MSVYLAGKYSDIEGIRENIEKIRSNGIEISYDWTIRAERNKNQLRLGEDLGSDAEEDIKGVMNAEWTIIMMTDKEYVYRGSFCELGASLSRDIRKGKRRTIIISEDGVSASSCCFYYHPGVIHCNKIEEAIEIIRNNKEDWKGF